MHQTKEEKEEKKNARCKTQRQTTIIITKILLCGGDLIEC